MSNCPQCGATVPDEILEGLCPDCLGRLALGVGEVSGSGFRVSSPGVGVPGSEFRVPSSEWEEVPLSPSLSPAPSGGEGARRAGEGSRFGDYELLGEIARGGMGVVYKARQVSLNRTVAVKMITAGQFASKEFVHRFRVEASAAAVLQHPNIVAVHEVGVHDGHHFFSMDYVAGKNLAQIVRDGPLSPMHAARYVQKIAEAIHYAHQSGILHRDLKPANVLIDQNDQPRITDFGLAKQLNVESSATLTGDVMGTPGYMPPEQASGNRGAVKAWSDVYSIGAILYHLMTGRAPFAAGSLEETLNQVLHQDPISVRLLNPAVPRDLDTICLKCLEKEPAKRYASAQLLAEELTRFLSHEPILAHPIGTVGKGWRWCRRKPALAGTSAVALLAVVLGFAGVSWQWRNSEDHRHLAERNAAQAQAAVTRLEIDRAEMLFNDGQSAEALAYLARVLRREPTNRVAGERIISALAYPNFCVPLFRLEHKADVTSAEFSPDGQRVLTASKDGAARIWDGRTGQPLLGPLQHASELTAAHFSPDGLRVVTVSLDTTARIWDARTGQPVTAPLRHGAGVLCADFSPDGQRLVTGSADGSMRLWNVAAGTPHGTTGSLEGGLDFVKYSPDGKWIMLAPRIGNGRILNASDGTEMATFVQHRRSSATATSAPGTFPSFSPDATRVATLPTPGTLDIGTGFASTNRVTRTVHYGSILWARFSPDSQTVATCGADTTAWISDASTIQPVSKELRHKNWINAIEFSPDGHQVVTGSRDHTARIWEAASGRPLSEPLRHDANVLSVQFSSDGQRILSLCEGPGVWVWEIRRGQPLTASLQHSHPVRRAVFSPDGERVATTTLRGVGADGLVGLWDARRAIPLLPPLGWGTFDVQFSGDGRLLLAVDGDQGTTTVWDSSTRKIVGRPFRETNNVERARFSPDGQWVATAGHGSQVRLWRVATGSLVREFPHRAWAAFVQFSPDGQWIVTTSTDATARLWDWRTGKPLTGPLQHDGAVVWADVSADSQRVATISRDQKARIWKASSGELLHTLPHAEEPYSYNSVQFSPDGRRVVTASGNTAQIWDSHTGQPTTVSLKHDERVNSVRFSPDGERLVTACVDRTARIWDVATGQSVSEPLRHRARVMYAEFSPNGRWVITASDDGTAKIWEVPTLTSSVPRWLAEWAEAVAGQRIDERNANQSVPFDEVHRLRQGLAQAADGDETTRWARWFFAENTTRTISPSSALTVAQLVQQRIGQYTLESLQQAVQLSPTNGLAQARLAYLTLTNDAAPNPRLVASLEWQSRRGVELSPDDPDAWRARAQFCDYRGRVAQALDEMDRATGRILTNANFWYSKGLLLEKTNRLEEALQSYTKAIEHSGPWKDQQTLPALAYRSRSKLNRRLNRLAEAGADNMRVIHLPQRDPGTPATHLDLSLYYNDPIDEPPPGREALATQFDLRGGIYLAPLKAEAMSTEYPGEKILGIPIALKCRRLYFLHGGWGQTDRDGTTVGVYRIHYADGQQTEIPIVYGEQLRFFEQAKDPKEALGRNTKVAFVGETLDKTRFRLFVTTWENERPDIAITSLDLISLRAGTAPGVHAITAEP